MASPEMDCPFTAEQLATATDISIDGELSIGTLAVFRNRAFAALEEAKTLKLSLRNASYLDAAAFQHLWALRLEAEQRGITVLIDDPPPAVRQDAETLGMQAIFVNAGRTTGTRDG